MYPIHESESGSFQELAHSSDVKFGQLSILTVNPRCERGGHYHKRKKEWFNCIYGRCKMEMVDIRDGSLRVVILNGSASREFVKVRRYERHIVKNLSNSEKCELLVIASEEYDENDPDTFKEK